MNPELAPFDSLGRIFADLVHHGQVLNRLDAGVDDLADLTSLDHRHLILINPLVLENLKSTESITLCGKAIDIESLQNRLLKVCYVPANCASLSRLLFCGGH
jgi:hypothetical protein